jgi:hypothetical protein
LLNQPITVLLRLQLFLLRNMDFMVKLGLSIPYREGELEQDIHLTDEARRQGVYIIGTTGVGKTSLLTSIIAQDMAAPEKPAVIVLDPHGDMIDELLTLVPHDRRREAILFAPADRTDQYEHPIGLNILDHKLGDMHEREFVSSTLISILYKLFFYTWGARMEDLLRNSVLTIMEKPGATLLDLWLLLVQVMGLHPKDPMFRDKLPHPDDPFLWAFWHEQIARYSLNEKSEIFSSSLNKLGRFLGNPIVRSVVAQEKSGFSMREVMDNGGILFCNLAKGDLGEDNSSLLGAVIINLILITALSRRNLPESERRPVHLIVDEYQTFATESFPILQSEARKYGITVTVAHQYRDQLDDLNKGSTMNSANLICMRISGRDGEELASQFDNTPPEPEIKYEPVQQQSISLNGMQTYVDHQAKGQTLKYAGKQPRRMYSDVAQERANQLTILPNHQAFVRVMNDNHLVEFRVSLDRVNRMISDKEKERRKDISDRIRAQSKELGTDRRLLEEKIRHRIQKNPPAVDGYSEKIEA